MKFQNDQTAMLLSGHFPFINPIFISNTMAFLSHGTYDSTNTRHRRLF